MLQRRLQISFTYHASWNTTHDRISGYVARHYRTSSDHSIISYMDAWQDDSPRSHPDVTANANRLCNKTTIFYRVGACSDNMILVVNRYALTECRIVSNS